MIFKDIDILDENFNRREHVNVEITNGVISYIGTAERESEEVISGKNRILIPGFFNAHAHSPMSLMRGYGENMTLQNWLFERIFPFEAKLDGKAVYNGMMLSIAESLKYGIVSSSDMYYFMDEMAEALSESGMKGNIARGITNMEGNPFDSLIAVSETKDAFRKYNGMYKGRIKVDASLHAEYTSDEQTARGLAELAKEYGMLMHVHVSETETEHEECKARRGGRTPVRYLADCGIFDVPAIAAHCVWIEPEDRNILKEKGVTVATNAVSNLKLASGVCDVKALLDLGVNVGIGTDSTASNNNLNFFEELKTMSLLAKVKCQDPTVITPKEALRCATLNGALAQGRKNCGLIKEGFRADMVMLKTDTANMVPKHSILNNIVLSATDSDIAMTIVDGKILYKDGEYTTIDIEKVIADSQESARNILKQL